MGGFLSNISLGPQLDGLVNALGKNIDRFITTDKERDEAKLEVKKTVQQFEMDLERELTKRHSSDMNSDSWLSKNVRPLVLAYSLVMVTLFAFGDGNIGGFEVRPEYIDMMKSILTAGLGFYYGGRTVEKLMSKYQDRKLRQKELDHQKSTNNG